MKKEFIKAVIEDKMDEFSEKYGFKFSEYGDCSFNEFCSYYDLEDKGIYYEFYSRNGNAGWEEPSLRAYSLYQDSNLVCEVVIYDDGEIWIDDKPINRKELLQHG